MNNSGRSIMAGVSAWILRRRYILAGVFLLLFVFSFFSTGWVGIEEDTTKFLPKGTQGRDSLDIDEAEFVSFGSADVLVEHLDRDTADALVRQLTEMQNIAYSTEDIHPDKEGSGYTVALHLAFCSESTAPESEETLQQILSLAGSYEGGYVYSPLRDNLTEIINHQMFVVILLVVSAVLVILVLTSHSYADIPVLLLVFAFAAVINMGTNFLLGTISVVSNAVAVVMQLALSLDYAIILCNRYREAHETLDIEPAIVKALTGAVPEILASSLTTIAGLFAMTFMKLTIGADMGFVLIKAIAISLLTVFLLMPCLLMLFGKAIDKTKHRKLLPDISALGNFSFATRIVVPAVFLLLAVGCCIGSSRAPVTYDVTYAPARVMSENDTAYYRLLKEGTRHNLEVLVPAGSYESEAAICRELAARDHVTGVTGIASLEVADGLTLSDPVGYQEIMTLAEVDETTAKAVMAVYAAQNDQHEHVLDDVSSYRAPLLDVFLCLHENLASASSSVELTGEQTAMLEELYGQLNRFRQEMQGENYSRIYVSLDLPMEGEETSECLDSIRELAASHYQGTVYVNSYSVVYKEFRESYTTDKLVVSIGSVVMVMLILFFTFRSAIMPVLLILVIQGSIWITFTLPTLSGNMVYFLIYLIVSCIMMGSNIDYAIVISSRYLELRKETEDCRQAMRDTLRFAFPTVMTSGGILAFSGFLIYMNVSESIVAGFGRHLGIGTLITMCLVLFVLPQILILNDRLIHRTGLAPIRRPDRKKRQTVRRYIICWVAAVGGILSIVSFTLLWGISRDDHNRDREKSESDLAALTELVPLAQEYDTVNAELGDSSMSFAEALLTDQIGSEQLAEGEKELAEGKELLEDGQAEYDAYEAMYKEGWRQYEEGLAQYEAGVAEYEAGKAEYEAGLAEYNAAVEQYEQVTPLYNAVIGPYNDYLQAQAEYDEQVALGEGDAAAYLRLLAQKALYETQLSATGYSISSLVAEYEAADGQLAAAQITLAESEQALADGEAQLADGKAQLESALQELSDAGIELNKGYEELQDYYSQYEEGQTQLEEARQQLSDNSDQLNKEVETLNRARRLREKLTGALEALNTYPRIRESIVDDMTGVEICSLIRESCESHLKETEGDLLLMCVSLLLLLTGGLLSLCVAVIGLLRTSPVAQIVMSTLVLVCSISAMILWIGFGVLGRAAVIAACVLMTVAALLVGIRLFINNTGSAPSGETDINGIAP